MTTKTKAPGKRSATKRVTKTAKPTRRSAGRTANKRAVRSPAKGVRGAADTTRKSASKRRTSRVRVEEPTNARTKTVSARQPQPSRTREAPLQVPHTGAAIVRELPRAPRRLLTRARVNAVAERGRDLVTRLRNLLGGLTQQLHLPHLPGKRTA